MNCKTNIHFNLLLLATINFQAHDPTLFVWKNKILFDWYYLSTIVILHSSEENVAILYTDNNIYRYGFTWLTEIFFNNNKTYVLPLAKYLARITDMSIVKWPHIVFKTCIRFNSMNQNFWAKNPHSSWISTNLID